MAVTYASGAAVLDLDTGRSIVDLAKGTSVSAVPAWHPEGKLLALAEGANRITLWDVSSATLRLSFEGSKNTVIAIAFNHAGSLLASTGWEGRLRLWDPTTGKQLFSALNPLSELRFSRDDQRLAGGVDGSRLVIWKVAVGREYRTLSRHPDALDQKQTASVAINSKHDLLAAGVGNGVQLFDLASGENLAFLKLSEQPFVTVGLNHRLAP